MLKTTDIKSIKTGHRQLTFGFDDSLQKENLILACVKKQIKEHGGGVLNDIVTNIKLEYAIDEISILQNIFWSALELKIHLRADKKNITPYQAKKLLLESPGHTILLITNKPVPCLIFTEMICFYNRLANSGESIEFTDQYEFSRSMFKLLDNWKNNIGVYKTLSKKKYWPGQELIQNCMTTLAQILNKQDSYSIIMSCYENQKKIITTAKTIHTILKFYTQNAELWKQLIQSLKQFDINLERIKQNPEIFDAYKTLTTIIAMPEPYDAIKTIKRYLPIVQKYNDQIETEKFNVHNKKIISRLDLMIEKLNILFQNNNSNPDFRNSNLYELRKSKKQIKSARTIKNIDFIFANAKDMYDDIIEDL